MKEETRQAVLDAIRDHPQIVWAAITGSFARTSSTDEYSDLDLLIVARNLEEVRNVRAWLPQRDDILISAFHLSHYCTTLLRGSEKIDMAIFSCDEPSSSWVVHDYKVIKGDKAFEVELAQAAMAVRKRAAYPNPDVCMDNVLLLLATAVNRADRGEELSAHAFVGIAIDMIIILARPQHGVDSGTDLLDPRRRVEKIYPDLAHALHASLFAPPHSGIDQLVRYLSTRYRGSMTREQAEVLDYLLETKER